MWREELAVLFLLSMGAVVAYFGLRALASERLLRVQLEKVVVQERLRTLRAQLNPHFLFNTLNSIVSLTQLRAESASQLILQLTHLLRQTLYASEQEHHELQQEFAYVGTYLQIQQIRQPLQISYRLSAEHGCMTAQLPTLLLLPLVENAVTHGLQPSRQVHIEVDASRSPDHVLLIVRNTYERQTSATGNPSTGLGLRNVRERLLVLYGQRAGVTTSSSTPGWFEARIHLPLTGPTSCER